MKVTVKRIVVMGGSFNPPSVAHYRLMRNAIDAIDADIGFFVPVSDAYLRRKMRNSHPPVVLSPELRIEMLRAMSTDSRMAVCDKEIGTIEARTVPTLTELQADYPDAEIYFLMGADKIELLKHLAEKRDFLKNFRVALYSREESMIESIIAGDEILSRDKSRIVILPQPEGTAGISSSLIRRRMLEGEPYDDLMCRGAWELFSHLKPEDFPDVIDKFTGEYDFLSNRFNCRFTWQGQKYCNAEAAFQSSKCTDTADRKFFSTCSADKAVAKGNTLTPPADWEERRLEIMESVLRAKFEQNPTLMDRLIATADRRLINGNSRHDTYWGVDLYTWQGENRLGKIIMDIRNKYRNEIHD